MKCINSDNCHSFSDAERLIYNAKVYLQSNARQFAVPPFRQAFSEALRVLTQAQRQVLDEWAAHVARDGSSGRSRAA